MTFRTEPLAYLLTWTTYGTWLRGDERGSVDQEHNIPGTPFAPANARRRSGQIDRLRHPAVAPNAEQRHVVSDTITSHCELRGWGLIAINVRTSHVHVVVDYPGLRPEPMLAQFKSWTTRRLREQGLIPPDERPWTAHGGTR